ncbi:hypothetical protein [Pseudoscardovia radai]|uniref:hypothetical protein n=1 Tax=Pseudoscardovia radai TaxID=987066 RepID=UPI003995807B
MTGIKRNRNGVSERFRRHGARRRAAAIAAIVALTTGGAAACGTTHTIDDPPASSESSSTGSISRAMLYGSIADLAAASDVVVVGSVASQKVVADIDGTTQFTVSTIDVSSVLKGDVQSASQIVVRQTGSANQPSGETFMTPDSTYLLYLVASGLDGDLASQYYVTGATAGIYEAEQTAAAKSATGSDASSVQTFSRVNVDSGDTLPATVTLEDALK